jgi:hypothetical protein
LRFYAIDQFEFLIIARTAKTLGIEMPPMPLARANEVIERRVALLPLRVKT